MTGQARWVVWFDEPGADDPALVGGKGANLARLAAAGFTVPRGFCVSALAYAEIMAQDGLGRRVTELLAAASDDDVARAAGQARQWITGRPLPPAVADDVGAAYERLGGSGCAVAVRSSATAEDLPEASFAGQQDTYLNVDGTEALLQAVRSCWASLWTERAVRYRDRHGFLHDQVRLAVVVQPMLRPRAAGVLFTANPINGRRDEAVVNAAYGLGDAVVSGRVTPDTFVVAVGRPVIKRRAMGDKAIEIVATDDGGTVERAVEGRRARLPSLSDDEVLELTRLGERVAERFGAPQDIEWAWQDGAFHLLQTRPITTLPARERVDERDHWTRAMFTEILPEAPSPAFCSVLEPVLTHMLAFTFSRLGQRPPDAVSAIGVFYHQPYLNLRYIDAALAGLPEASRARLRGRIANPFADHAADTPRRGVPRPADLLLLLRLAREARSLPAEVRTVVERYHAALEPYRSHDLQVLEGVALARDLRRVAIDLLAPLVAYDFLLIAVLGFAQRVLEATARRSGAGDPLHLRGRLMSGVTGNVTMETNKALWRLAAEARREPEVMAALQTAPEAEALALVRALPGGEGFVAALDAFLADHGHREAHMDIRAPTWGEDPAPVLRFVRAYLAEAGAPDPADLERAATERRHRAADEVRAGLRRTRGGRLLWAPLFEGALRSADALAAERDTMHYHWTAAFPVLRRMLHETGARLVGGGHLDQPDHVYYLTLTDLEGLLHRPEPAREAVARRRAAWRRDRHGPWPVEIRHGEEVFHEPVAAEAKADGTGALAGVAGSPGLVTGEVRVVRGPEEFGSLRRGEILVAPLTNPVWTPLFALAAAVVTESGGILSHGAIVAREYGIPAVMGVDGATELLRDGMVVTVDGTRGLVTPGG